MLALLGLHFDNRLDLTAIGTIALACVTFVSLLLARGALKSSQQELLLSRAEVERAHLPVVVPIVDHRRMDLGLRGTTERVPKVADGKTLVIPVENIGTGPALGLEARATLLDGAGTPTSVEGRSHGPAESAGLGVGSFTPLEIAVPHWTVGANFSVRIAYGDLAGRRWETRAGWSEEHRRYVDVRIVDLPAAIDAGAPAVA